MAYQSMTTDIESKPRHDIGISFFAISISWMLGYLYKAIFYGYYGQNNFFYATILFLPILWLAVLNPLLLALNRLGFLKNAYISFFSGLVSGCVIFSVIILLLTKSQDWRYFFIGYGATIGSAYSAIYYLVLKNRYISHHVNTRLKRIMLHASPAVFIAIFSFFIWPSLTYLTPSIVCLVGPPASANHAKINYLKTLKVGDDIGHSISYTLCMSNNFKNSIMSRSIFTNITHTGSMGDGFSNGYSYSYDIKITNGIIRKIIVSDNS